jgi:protoporphyrinogen oxidase
MPQHPLMMWQEPQAMPEPSGQRVCVIGAGLTGLVSACSLLAAGHDVVLLESAPEPGGMIAAFPMGSDRIEYIYHHIFTNDHLIIQMLEEIGLADRLKWYRPRDALCANYHLYPFSTPLDLIRFPLIPFWQRLRTGLAVLQAGRLIDWSPLEKETAAQWLLKNSGREAYARLWQPLLRSKFDQDADDVSAVWIWNKFKLRGNSRDKDAGSEKLGYLDGSFGALIDALVALIREKGGEILTGHTAMNISRPDPGGRIRISCILENCTTVNIEADGVIATVSGRQFAGMTTSLDWPEVYRNKINRLQYKGDLCLVLRLRRSLSPYYWTTICDDLPFVVVVEHTNLVGPKEYGGHVVYLSRYLDIADPLWMQSDGAIFRQFVRGLEKIYPHFSLYDVIDWRLRRTRYAQPVINRHYSANMPDLNTPAPGIKLAGMAQIYPEDRGMNYAVRLGVQAAQAIIGDLEMNHHE